MAASEFAPTWGITGESTTVTVPTGPDTEPGSPTADSTDGAASSKQAKRSARPKRSWSARRRGGPKRSPRVPLLAPARRPGRRVVRIVRHVQLWSVFKVTFLGGLVLYGIFLLAVLVGWSLANSTGQVRHVEQFMRDIGFDNWSFNGAQLFRGAALAGSILLAMTTIFVTLWAAVVNLIAEATGGLRFTVIETDEGDDDTDDPDEA